MFNPGRGYKNEFRIIAGRWRRRRLKFPPLPGIRPSPDRVRETLFNWLMPRIAGARCLDLFAGSGALGLEALSRGATSVLFIDQERQIVDCLRTHLESLHAANGEVLQSDALAFLRAPQQVFDIVFLDPPFTSLLLADAARDLEQYGWLAPAAQVYMEYPLGSAPQLPAAWEMFREGHAGRVGFGLARYAPAKLARD
ncbi:MAG: 16S rRNA (guanine(966)-N(2))-methyltransferase RsmD [Gammaproteobacteria bacterium]